MATRRLVTTCLAVTLLTAAAGCATTKSVEDTEEPVDYRGRAEGLPLGETTLGVASMHPERLDELAERDRAALSEWFAVVGSPPAPHMASRTVAALFESMARVSSAVDQSETDFRFEGLDRSRSMYFALTARGHTGTLRDLEVATPRSAVDGPFGGRLARLLVPADEPEALVEEFESHCSEESDEWMGGRCGAVVRFAAVGGYAVADLYYGPEEPEVRKQVVSALPEDPSAPSGYFERLTPAARAFVGRRAAVGVFARTEDLWKIAVLERLTSVDNSTDRGGAASSIAARIRRMGSQASPYARLARQVRVAAPELREHEDIALLHGYEEGHFVDAVRSYTARGHRIAEAGRLDTKLPRLALGDPMLTLEWAYDAPAALRLGAIPGALADAGGLGTDGLGEILALYEPLAGVTPLVAYPVSSAKFLANRSYGRRPGRADALARLGGVRALRAALDVAPSEEGPLGVEFSGAAVVEIARESNLDATVETAVALARGAGLPVRMAANYQGEHIQLKVTMNASMSVFGDPTPVGGTRVAHLDLGKLAGRFDDEDVPDELHDVEVPDQPETARHLEVARAATTGGRGLRIRLGSEERQSFSIPAADVDLARPSAPPPCVRRALAAARRLLLEGGGRDLDVGAYTEALPKLVRGAKACAGEPAWAERLNGVAAAQLVRFGDAKATIGEWDEAKSQFAKACEFGAEEACRRAEKAAERAERLQLPEVGHTETLRGSVPESVLEVNRDGLRVGGDSIASLEQLSSGTDSGTSVIAAMEKQAGPVRMTTMHGNGITMPVAAETSLRVRHIQALARQAFETTLPRSSAGRNRSRYAKVKRERSRKTQSVVFFVKDPGGQRFRHSGPNYLAIRREKPTGSSADDQSLGLSVTVTLEGFQVRTQEGTVDSIEGCPDDGPTVCLRDNSPAIEQRLTRYDKVDARDDNAAAREAASAVAGAFPYHRLYRVLIDLHERHVDEGNYRTPVRLSVDEKLPFEVLAKTIATAARRRWNVEGYESAGALFADNRRTRPMFDVVYLDLSR